MPDHPIIDAHVHLTDPARIAYPWMAGVPALRRPWAPPDFDRLSGGVTVEAMVFVEVDAAPADRMAEAQHVADLAATDARLQGMVASVEMDRGEATVAALNRMRGFPLLRGVRHLIEGHADTQGWAARPEMVEGVRLLAPHGLVFDLCLRHPQLTDATALVRACPDVTFVLDHIGKPGIRAGYRPQGRDQLGIVEVHPLPTDRRAGRFARERQQMQRQPVMVMSVALVHGPPAQAIADRAQAVLGRAVDDDPLGGGAAGSRVRRSPRRRRHPAWPGTCPPSPARRTAPARRGE